MKNEKKNSPTQNNLTLWGVVAVVLVLLGWAAWSILGQARPAGTAEYPAEVSVARAAELRDQNAFILDVRQPEEWNEFHIPGATLIPLEDLQNRLSEVPQDQEIVVVCRSGNRSATGRDILRKAGLTQVSSMAGGMNEWRSAGYPTVSGP